MQKNNSSALNREAQEGFIQGIMDNVSDAIITIDEHGIVGTYNRAAREMFGYASEEVVGQNVSMLMPPPTVKNMTIIWRNI